MEYITYFTAFLLAVVLSYGATHVVRRVALRRNIVDEPDGFRKTHSRPTPLLGGVSVYLAFFISLPLATALQRQTSLAAYLSSLEFWRLMVGGLCVLLIGMVDDIRDMGAGRKFSLLLAVSLAMYAGGDRIARVGMPFAKDNAWDLGWLALPITLFWFLGCINSINLIDGMDGAASGVTAFAALTIFASAIMLHNPAPAVFALCLAGAAAGFLVHNFPPASIYLGDSGSLLLGFLLASIGLRGASKGAMVVALLIPVIAMGLPIIDTSLALIRRWARGLPLSATDRDHIHHKLQNLGLSHRSAVLAMYGACIVLAVFALLLTAANNIQAAWILAGLGVVSVVSFRVIGHREWRMARARIGASLRGMKRRNNRRVAAHFATGSMANAPNVRTLWKLLTDVAEEIDLDELHVLIECPRCSGCTCRGMSLEYEWRHPDTDGEAEGHIEWMARLPLSVEDTRLGEMTIRTFTNGRPMGSEVPQTLEDLAEAFALNACRIHRSTPDPGQACGNEQCEDESCLDTVTAVSDAMATGTEDRHR